MWRTKENPRHNAGGFLNLTAGEQMKTYCKPLKRGTSWRSQNFGESATIYGPHSGNDEACNSGTPVHAAGDGVIEWAGEFDDSYEDNMFWLLRMGGNVAVLNCGDNEPSFMYAHLSTFYVRPGDRVKKGQVIALSGNSGYATTGAHLHVEAIPPGYVLNSPLLGRVDPDIYLTEWPEDLRTIEETMAKLDAEDLKNIYQAVWFGVPGAKLIPNELTKKGEWPYTSLGSMTARIKRDVIKPSLPADEIAALILGELGDGLAADVVAELGKRISK